MKKRTAEEWLVLFAEHEASGLSAAAFCRERGLCPKYFSLRRRQLHDRSAVGAQPAAFVPVSMASPASGVAIEIRLGEGLALRVPVSVSARWLAELVHQLRN